MQYAETPFLPNDLELKHAYVEGDRLHHEGLGPHVIHEHVDVLDV